MSENETRIIHCERCNLHTRHTRARWVRRPLPLLILGRVRVFTGWRCTKCSHRIGTRSRAVRAKQAQ